MVFRHFLFSVFFLVHSIVFSQDGEKIKDTSNIVENLELDELPILVFNDSCLKSVKQEFECRLVKVYLITIIDTNGELLEPRFTFTKGSFHCADWRVDTVELERRFQNQISCVLDNIIQCKPGIKDGKYVKTKISLPITINWK